MATPDTIYAKSYGSIVAPLSQQEGSKLRNLVTVKSGVNAEETYMDQLTAFTVKTKGSRLSSTNPEAIDTPRRRLALEDKYIAKALDKSDDIRTLADPTSAIVQSGIYGMGREIDSLIYTAARGTAYTGKVGGTSVALPSAQKIAHGSTGFTLTKWREAITKLNQADVKSAGRVLVISASMLEDILADSTITSHDFNSVRALVEGNIHSFLGCEVKMITEDIITTTSSTQYGVLYQKDALGLAIGADVQSRITEESQLHFAKQLYFSMSMGASRLEEVGVVEIAVTV